MTAAPEFEKNIGTKTQRSEGSDPIVDAHRRNMESCLRFLERTMGDCGIGREEHGAAAALPPPPEAPEYGDGPAFLDRIEIPALFFSNGTDPAALAVPFMSRTSTKVPPRRSAYPPQRVPPPSKHGHGDKKQIHCRLAFDPKINEYGAELDECKAKIDCEIHAFKAATAGDDTVPQKFRKLQDMRKMASLATEAVEPLHKARKQVKTKIHKKRRADTLHGQVAHIGMENEKLVIMGDYNEPSGRQWNVCDGEGPEFLVMNAMRKILPNLRASDPIVLETQEAVEIFISQLTEELNAKVKLKLLVAEDMSRAIEYLRMNLAPKIYFRIRDIKKPFGGKRFDFSE
jgi:histone H3/H4